MKHLKEVTIFGVGVAVGFITCGILVIKSNILSASAINAISNCVDAVFMENQDVPRKKSTTSKISYMNYYGHEHDNHLSNRLTSFRSVYDIVLATPKEAGEVLDHMRNIINTYGIAYIQDLYDFVGIEGSFYDRRYGWTDIKSASVIKVKGGYKLYLPKATKLYIGK